MSSACSGGSQGLIARFLRKISIFVDLAWYIAVSEPKKVIHCLKVGLALSIVSLFYYMKPLYDGFGGTAMWAVLTVTVVFEYTVGATLYKCMNRTTGTFVAGSLGLGVHWVASQSGKKIQLIILGASVFLFASVATFSRFMPIIKSRFDYGAMIFILTFSLVAVSGYRVDKLLTMAQHRVYTILLGTSVCVLTSILICPVWAGNELHLLIHRNLEKLADSLEEFFNNGEASTRNEDSFKKVQGCVCVFNTTGTMESLANFGRWEPPHGSFHFGHPWKQYLKIGSTMRNCGFAIESLHSCINVEVPESLKMNFTEVCVRLSYSCSRVLKELAATMKNMTKSSTIHVLLGEMNFAVQQLQDALRSLPNQLVQIDEKGEPNTKQFIIPLMEILPLTTTVFLLTEIAMRIEGIADAVVELTDLAEFKPANDGESKQWGCLGA